CIVAQPLAIDMTNHGRALGAARPVVAGTILLWRGGAGFGGRAGQYVMTGGGKTYARDKLAPLAQRGVHAVLGFVALRIVDILSDNLALEILPWPAADAVARIDGRLALGRLRAQIGMPGFAARAMALCQLQTVSVGAVQAAEVGSLARPGASHKECHGRGLRQLWRWLLLCLDACRHAQC